MLTGSFRSYHGNYPVDIFLRPYMEVSMRAVPGSSRYMGVASPHHRQAYGTLILVDPGRPDDRRTSQVKRVTPEVPFPEAEAAPGVPRHAPHANMVYGTPWPLAEDFCICVYAPPGLKHGIYLVDRFGNRELLYRDPAIACLDPIPLQPRPRPPAIPARTIQAAADRPPRADLAEGTVVVLDVYEGDGPWPEGRRVRELRVINVFPKDNFKSDDPDSASSPRRSPGGSWAPYPWRRTAAPASRCRPAPPSTSRPSTSGGSRSRTCGRRRTSIPARRWSAAGAASRSSGRPRDRARSPWRCGGRLPA